MTVTPPVHRRRPVLATGLGVAGVVTALAACQPSSAPPAPSYTYTPPPYTPSYTPYTAPSTTTTTEEATTTTPPSSSGGGYYVPSTRGPDEVRPCLPTAIPAGYECTCNCVPD